MMQPPLNLFMMVLPGIVLGSKIGFVATGSTDATLIGAGAGGAASFAISEADLVHADRAMSNAAFLSFLFGTPAMIAGAMLGGRDGARLGAGIGLGVSALFTGFSEHKLARQRAKWKAIEAANEKAGYGRAYGTMGY